MSNAGVGGAPGSSGAAARAGNPAVSVLLPVRDGMPHLDAAIESLLAQTFRDFEIIAVDDGSTDGTPDTLERWAARDGRVRVLTRAASGIVPALEAARAAARGRYLARMDADDLAHPERLAAQFALLESDPDLVGCGCGVRYFPDEVVRDGARRYERWLNGLETPDDVAAAIFVECPLAHPTFFLRADSVEAVGGYVDVPWPEDYDLVLRLWGAGGRLATVPRVLHEWRESPDRLSRTSPRYSAEAFVACKVHHLRRTLLAGGRPAVVWGAGPVGKRFARALAAEGTPIEAFVELAPGKIGQMIHGAPVLDTDAALALLGGGTGAGALHLSAVGQPGARSRIAASLEAAGARVGNDFVAVA